MLKRSLLALAMALAPLGLHASPTRALTLDDQQMLVPDDYDATIYYHLAPYYNNHLYVDVTDDGTQRGWAFLDIKAGTLVLWWNKESEAKGVFDTLASGNKLGYQALDLGSNTGNAQAPLEGWIGAPQVKASVGYAYQFSEAFSAALCLQYGTLDQTRNSSSMDGGSNTVLAPGAPLSLARYMTMGAGYYTDLSVSSFSNTQSSSELALAPSIGINASDFALDLKAEAMYNHINNQHQETVADSGGDMQGSITQGLRDEDKLSWLAMGKLRVPLREGNLILRGGYFDYDFSTQHTEQGSFSGSGFANSGQLAGFGNVNGPQVDAEENLIIRNWNAMLGWTEGIDKVQGTWVIGLGVNGSSVSQEDILYQPRNNGGTINYDDLVRQTRNNSQADTLAMPLVMGTEVVLAKFMRCRGSVSRNFYYSGTTSTAVDSYNIATGNLSSQQVSQNNSDQNAQWNVNAGVGFYFGAFIWDIAVNDAFLGSEDGLANIAYQSTLTWGY
jgi:hypothetical protein